MRSNRGTADIVWLFYRYLMLQQFIGWPCQIDEATTSLPLLSIVKALFVSLFPGIMFPSGLTLMKMRKLTTSGGIYVTIFGML